MAEATAERHVPQGTWAAFALLVATFLVGLWGVQEANHGGCNASIGMFMLLGLGVLIVPIVTIVCVVVRRYRHPGWILPTLIRVATIVALFVFLRMVNTIQEDTYYGGCD